MSDSPHLLLFGYEVTSSDKSRPGVPGPFLMQAARLHAELDIPCTFFVRGELLGPYQADFQRARDLLGDLADFEQATWSGALLKTICQQNHQGVQVFPAPPLETCCDEIARTSETMLRTLGIQPTGLAAPLGAYRGLSDRPDILHRLAALGINFLRSHTRNFRDWYPLAFEVQPYRYAPQGVPQILEIPGQGWPDHILRETLGRDDPDRYVRQVKKDLDYVAAKGLVWSFVQQDWTSIADDPEMRRTRLILEYARERGFKMQTHRAFAEAFRTSPHHP